MNIVIPLCGLGSRFIGIEDKIKPFITVFTKNIISYTIESFVKCKIYIIINNLCNIDVELSKLLDRYSNIEFVNIDTMTGGASETVYLGLKKINVDNFLVVDGDSFYLTDIMSRIGNQNSVVYYVDKDALSIFSFIELVDDRIIDIAEKKKISDNVNTGAYYFNSRDEFNYYFEYIKRNGIKFNNEYYISTVIQVMLKAGIEFRGIEIDKKDHISLGTPDQLNEFKLSQKCYLFDLDGTLVKTDVIYTKVWNEILLKYNVHVDDNFFKNNISGLNDRMFLKDFLNLEDNVITEISLLKDSLFLKYIDNIETVEGSIEFVKEVKRRNILTGIVTNCNRNTAENVLKYLNIENDIDVLIIGNECEKSKPNSEPYLCALRKLNFTNLNNVYIFEDSKIGLMSAYNVNPKCVICVNNQVYKEYYDICISSFTSELIEDLNVFNKLKNKNDVHYDLNRDIYNSVNKKMNINVVEVDNDFMKGGYISDVINVKLDDKNYVLKKENLNENYLCYMANNLDLYNNEYYFYENVYPFVKLNTPVYYGTVRNSNFKKVGILMENLMNDDYNLNLNLNEVSISVCFKIIDDISSFHLQFYNKIDSFKDELRFNNNNKMDKYSYINDHIDLFVSKWEFIMDINTIELVRYIGSHYRNISDKLSVGKLTLIHGDLKSPNIFYRKKDNVPYFIDWQYLCIGKGMQDIVFLLVESINIDILFNYNYFDMLLMYYYNILKRNNIYSSYEEYYNDVLLSLCHFPYFVSILFGVIDIDELNDKNFPFHFIKKYLIILNKYINIEKIKTIIL